MCDVSATADIVAKRTDVLRALTTPLTKPELVEALDTSRSTVDRAVGALQDCRLVEREGSRYRVTFAGEEALAAYEGFLDRLETLLAAQPVLAALDGHVDVDPAILHGADVVESTRAAPEAPIEHTISLFEGATKFRGTGPAVIPRYIDAMVGLVERGATVELVVTQTVADALESEYPDGLADLTDAATLSLFVTDEPMSTAVWTAERPSGTVSGLVTYADAGISGVVNNDTETMNAWAADQYEAYRESATRLD
ncbi:helix-turn-helix transcriptional regulator [Halomicroarcula sp. GCM10025817]|uniref:helix-turn-helix transcriptional regulator n=1 Tax=Haloarcula TaxID=2237 RepID=UPI0023E81E1C|nr:hypothetical protein [Halomicroarcula sp. SYNS111]